MLHQNNHTKDINIHRLPLLVASTDCCQFFERRNDTFFNGHDSWHCKYGEFGLYTDTPTEEGYCKYKGDE